MARVAASGRLELAERPGGIGAFVATGLVGGFVPVVATQMLWGLSWTFASGADVAWISPDVRRFLPRARSGRPPVGDAPTGQPAPG
ncbi:hypothetical protein FRAHR75_400041 [Frankia sp. Hr75.2]|nr:hypothetical protein E0504_35185 [Parafrankia sp. BMG5.11]CAI7978000.1 hypothetical protein FRAHR75_400041 [Frankia sp. Hr75.2]SQD99293.1 hypothetical protein FMEAI12_5210005 [Parafrankia sp. Ea1.12]